METRLAANEAPLPSRAVVSEAPQQHHIAITGGTGFFGQYLAQHFLATHPDTTIRLISNNEQEHKVAQQRLGSAARLRWILGDIRQERRMVVAFARCDAVIHAAALKHVDVCEQNPAECIGVNILGAQTVAEAAQTAGVPRAVFLSTDKAVAPTTMYGASKLAGEKAWVQMNAYTPESTGYNAVRYGNVAGSRGSVLDVFARRLQAGEPLQVTDEQATRFWMTAQEAVALVAWAMRYGAKGAVYIPQLPAFQMGDLLQAIEHVLGRYLAVQRIGLRPAEKQHEVLAMPEELARASWYALPESSLVIGQIFPAYQSWSAREQEGVPGGLPMHTASHPQHYHSGDTPWRLSVADLAERLQRMGWMQHADS